MKTIKLSTTGLLMIFYFTACHVESAKVVETEKQTLECIVGNWVPENDDPAMSRLEFHAQTMAGEQSGSVTASGGVNEMTGTWQYKAVGEIELSNTDGISDFELLDCKRGIVNSLTIYVKE